MTDVITKKTTGEIKNREAALRRQRDLQSRVWRSPPARQAQGSKRAILHVIHDLLPPPPTPRGNNHQPPAKANATDPDFLEKRLGERASNGCIRISATLNHFIDRYGLIDADYEQVAQHGRLLWVLRGDRTPVATPGRYLVVVDTQRAALPAWARRP